MLFENEFCRKKGEMQKEMSAREQNQNIHNHVFIPAKLNHFHPPTYSKTLASRATNEYRIKQVCPIMYLKQCATLKHCAT
mmetsp:Transcript_5528/g.20803  ORF Transcript_5528/g.20803 Transcript_5528/m.20803 type:complete len:80 (-) Transcript_5528:477-716(-)